MVKAPPTGTDLDKAVISWADEKWSKAFCRPIDRYMRSLGGAISSLPHQIAMWVPKQGSLAEKIAAGGTYDSDESAILRAIQGIIEQAEIRGKVHRDPAGTTYKMNLLLMRAVPEYGEMLALDRRYADSAPPVKPAPVKPAPVESAPKRPETFGSW